MKKTKIAKLLSITLLTTSIMTMVSPITANAAWKQNSIGWWYTEGNYWAIGWKKISGLWYYFDANGYMKTGWLKDKDKWYYLSSSGEMKTGWIKVSDKWYYLDDYGVMQTGWVKVSGSWYHMDNSGAMQTGWFKDSTGYWYYLKIGGKMADDEWIKDDGKIYYIQSEGIMLRSVWFNKDNKVYFIKDDGSVHIGWKEDRYGDKFYFDENGVAARGLSIIDGIEYYFNNEGNSLQRNVKETYISTDSEGRVIARNFDSVKDIILENDSNYLDKLKEKYDKIELASPQFTGMFYCFTDYGNLYEINPEEAFLVGVLGTKNSSQSIVSYYLVGAESKKVYSIKSDIGSKAYEVKDNKIVSKYRDLITLNNADWR